MVLATAVPSLGATTFSTPSAMVALILSASMLRGRVSEREKAP